jgi:hypothetical protein
MDEEREEVTRAEFEEVLELTRENNRILKSIQKSSRWSKVFSVLWMLIVLGGMLYLYYILQPYIEDLMELYEMSKNAGSGGSEFLQQFLGGEATSSPPTPNLP